MCSLKIKVFSSVLAFIMVVSAFPVYAFISYAAESAGVPPVNILSEDIQGATEPEELSGAEPMAETDFTYTIANDEVTISGYTGTDAEVLIPEEIESFPVTAVAVDAFKNNTVMETVVIPACVETIGSSAFEGSSVKFVTVFGGTVGDNAFKSCLSLQLMALGDGVTNVSSTAFLGCSSLTSITVTQDNAVYSHIDGVLFNDAATALLCYPAAKSNVVYFVPDTVAEIAADAFYGTRFLSNIVIKGNVTTISGSNLGRTAGEPPVNISGFVVFGYTDTAAKTYADTYGITFYNLGSASSSGFTYTVSNNCATITGYTASYSYVIIPAVIEGYPVTAIAAQAFNGKKYIGAVYIPDSVTTIGKSAFSACAELSNVRLSKGLVKLGGDAFTNCDKITEIEIPKSLTTIDTNTSILWFEAPFEDCNGLKTVTFESGATKVTSFLFARCPGIERVVIPDTVTVIEDYAFYEAINLRSITFSQNLTSIGKGAFCNCAELCNVTLPKGLVTMGTDAFKNCDKITEIEIPKSLESITGCDSSGNGGPFQYCDGLKTVTFESGATRVANNLFKNCEELENIVLPDTVTEIGGYAFGSINNLKSITLSQNLTWIGQGAFSGCTSLESIDIPDSVTTIGKSAFSACAELSNVRLSKGLVKLGGDAFTNCDKITEIEIPKSLTTIDTNTSILWFEAPFEDCNGLKTVTFESGATKVTSFLFARCPGIERVVIPDTVTVIEDMAFYEAINLRSITFSQSLTSIGESTFTGCASLESIDIPDSVTIIGKYAFSACSSLTSATLSNTLLYLPDQIFYNCISLTSVDLPLNLTLIGSSAFYNCSALTAITLPEKITVINGSVFYNCDGLTEIVIPEGVTDIYSSAFYDCDSLTDLVLPSSLNKIWSSAFRYCDLLKNITFGNKLVSNTTSSIDSYAFADCPAIESLTLPRGMATVGQYAFLNDIYLTSLHIPVTVTSIDATAISYPSRLTIFGVSGSYAQTYAIQKGANFTDIANHIDGLILKDNPDERYEMVKGEYLVPEFEFSTEFEGETTDVIILTSSHSRVTINNNRLYAANTGEATITATTSGGLTYQFTVYVRSVSSIAVTTPPLKMEYAYGEALDLAGMVVTATYNDSFSQPVTGYTISGYNPAVYGNQTVTVTYAAKTATFIVMVVDDRVYVTSIAVTTPPNKTTYIKGELLNTAGMVVTATYTDASTGPVTGFTVTGYNKLKLGAQTLTVTYADPTTAQIFTTTFQVTVVLEIVQVLTPVAGSGCVVDFANRYIYGLTPGTISLQGFAETTAGYEIVCIPTALGFGTGTVVNVMLGGSIVESYTVVIFGDINGDGSIDSIDAGNMVDYENYMVTWDPLIDAAKIKAADLNGDGTIDSIDAGIAVDAENYMVTIDQSTGLVAGG